MQFLKRYLAGETVTVYNEVAQLGPKAFEQACFNDISAVLKETFRRTAHNLDIIHHELLQLDYNFKKDSQYDFEQPILESPTETEKLLEELQKQVKPIGYVPLSIQFFYLDVGACNFAWDYERIPAIPWEGSDPLQIAPLKWLISETKELWDDDEPLEEIQLGADFLHKDNISGGPAYAIEITKNPSIDGLLLNEEHDTTFINYLRLAFNYGGFSRGEVLTDNNDFQAYLKNVRPKLLPI